MNISISTYKITPIKTFYNAFLKPILMQLLALMYSNSMFGIIKIVGNIFVIKMQHSNKLKVKQTQYTIQ